MEAVSKKIFQQRYRFHQEVETRQLVLQRKDRNYWMALGAFIAATFTTERFSHARVGLIPANTLPWMWFAGWAYVLFRTQQSSRETEHQLYAWRMGDAFQTHIVQRLPGTIEEKDFIKYKEWQSLSAQNMIDSLDRTTDSVKEDPLSEKARVGTEKWCEVEHAQFKSAGLDPTVVKPENVL